MGDGLTHDFEYREVPSKPMDLAARKSLFYYANQNSDFFKEDTTLKFVKTCRDRILSRVKTLQSILHDSLDPQDASLYKALNSVAACQPFCVKCYPIRSSCKYRYCPWCHARRVHRIGVNLLRGINADHAVYDSDMLIMESESEIVTDRRVVVLDDPASELLSLASVPRAANSKKIKNIAKSTLVRSELSVQAASAPDKLAATIDNLFTARKSYTKNGNYSGLVINTHFKQVNDRTCIITNRFLEAFADPAAAKARHDNLLSKRSDRCQVTVKLVTQPKIFDCMDMLGTAMAYDYGFVDSEPEFVINLIKLLNRRRLSVASGLFSSSTGEELDGEIEDGTN